MPVRATVALLAILLPVPTVGEPLRLCLGWDDMRAIASHAEIASRITVWLEPEGSRPAKVHLREITESGITLGKGRKPRFVPRSEVREVRLIPIKGKRFPGHPYRLRTVAAIAAVPLWLFTHSAAIVAQGGTPHKRLFTSRFAWLGYATATPMTYFVYRAARNADRRRGAIIIELDHGR